MKRCTNPKLLKRILAGATVLAFAGMIACGGKPTASPTSQQAVTIKISDYSPEQKDFHQQVADQYHNEHPNVTIEWTSIAQAQYNQTLPLAFQSHQAPDIFFWKSDLNPVLTMSYLLDQSWIRPLGNDGKVPAEWQKRWPDGTFVEGSPATWTELAQDCAAIKSKEPDKFCAAIPLKGTDPQRWWYNLAASVMIDQPFFDLKSGHFDLNDPRLVKAFGFLQSLYKSGYVAPGVNDKDFSRQQVAAGQAAMYMDGAWMPGVWTQQGFDSSKYGVAAMPYPDDAPHGGLAQRYSENKYWISSQSGHPAEAWDFIEWVTQPDGFFAQGYLKGGFGTLAFADNQKYLTDPAMQQVIKIGTTKGFRALDPEPLLKCPDLTKSKALADASALHPNWEWETITDAIVNNKNFAATAKEVVDARQRVLTDELDKEKAAGLKVSLDCYTFADWNYNQDFDASEYPKQQ